MTDRLGQDVGMEEGGVLAQLGASGASTDTEMVAGLSSPYDHSSSFAKTDGVHNLGHSSSSAVLGDLACQDHSSALVAPDGFSPDDHSSSDELSQLAHSPSFVEEAPQQELVLPPVCTFHK